VPPERALLTLADASGGLSALFALDSDIERHLDWLLRATEEVGQSPMRSDAATKDARVAELVHPSLPETFGPFELLAVEASFVNGMTLSLRTATDSLQALRDPLADVDDDESRGLAQRIQAFPQVVTP